MKAVFTFTEPLFSIEDRPMDRSSIRILKKGKSTTVTVEATDAVAFRASCNAILRELAIAGKARSLMKR